MASTVCCPGKCFDRVGPFFSILEYRWNGRMAGLTPLVLNEVYLFIL